VNPWFGVFSAALADANYSIEPEIFPAATDSRFIRKAGVAALGFSPMRHERVLLHDHDERVKAATFVEGLRVYEHLIPRLADADPALFAQ
jgi:aminoacylase